MTKEGLEHLIDVARGLTPADLLLANARVVNVFSGEVERADVALAGRWIAGVGSYEAAQQRHDLGGSYLLPGFIDGHLHLESTMLMPAEFARAAVPHGTNAIVVDPHEIANVHGVEGVRFLLEASKGLPLDVFFTAPCCVPATGLETAGAHLGPAEIAQMLAWPKMIALGELMNVPGALTKDREALAKVIAAHSAGKPVEGHSPGLSGLDLCAYVALGADSDHECTAAEEAREKLERGMWLMIREGSAARNLEAVLPTVTETNGRRCLLVSDDLHPEELLSDGHLDRILRRAVRAGIQPAQAVPMVTLNPAERFGLKRRGAVAPGHLADLVVVDDLREFRASAVYKNGCLVAEKGAIAQEFEPPDIPLLPSSIRMALLDAESFRIKAPARDALVIGIVPDQILTRKEIARLPSGNGWAMAAPHRDLLKIAVVERHHRTGNVGVGFVRGFGLRKGAVASSVAHDSHNLIVVGASDQEMLRAVQEVARMAGGFALVVGESVLASFPLPIAGLISAEPVKAVGKGIHEVTDACRSLGARGAHPLMTLSFLALPVIPEIRITDKGLVDVAKGCHVPLEAGK